MKKILSLLSLAALTVGLLGSCSKIDERISNLEKRIDGIEATSIASVQQQIDGIKASITKLEAADVTVNGKIDELKATTEAQQTLIDALKEADKALGQKDTELEARIAALEGQVATINGQIKTLEEADKTINDRIDELKTYVDTEIGKTKDWAEETFATLEQYQKTADGLAALSVTVTGISTTLAEVQTSIARLGTKINGIDAALQGKITDAKTELEGKITSLKTELEGKIADAIAASETSLQGWVNKQLEGYYTIAQVDAKVKGLQNQIDNLKKDDETNKKKIAELESNLKKLTQDLETAKTTIKAEYGAAIKKAIEENNGTITKTIQSKIDKVNTTIAILTGRVDNLETAVGALTGRVDAIEAMIQTVSIIPAYNNGSVKAEDGILTITCVITPKEVVKNLTKTNFTVLTSVSEVLTKSAAPYGTITIAKDEDLTLDKTYGTATIKVDVSNSLPTEENKALTVAVNVSCKHSDNLTSNYTTEFVPVESHFTYAEIAGVKWALENLAVSESGKREFNNTGHVIGDYFQWATYAGYCGDASGSDKGLLIYSSFTSTLCGDAENSFSFKDPSYWFSIYEEDDWGSGSGGISPYNDTEEGDYFKYDGDSESTLESTDDAASIILGGEWRMPTIEEYQSLYNATYWAWDATDFGYYVFLLSDVPGKSAGTYGEITGLNKSKAKLFFPAAGYVDYFSFPETPCAQYLSSTYEPYEVVPGVKVNHLARKFRFDATSIDTDQVFFYDRRSCGASIRPVKAETAE